MGITSSLGISAYELKYHSFESYYNNPEFQLQQTIQRLLLENAIKESNQKGLSNDKD